MANTVCKALGRAIHIISTSLVSSQNHLCRRSTTQHHHINSSCHVPRCSASIRSTELGRKLFLRDRVYYNNISFSSPTIFPLAHQFSFSLALTHLYGDPSYQNIADIPFCPDFASEVSGTRSAENRCSPALSQAASMIMIRTAFYYKPVCMVLCSA